MHELSVTESILNIALENAAKTNASKVTSINLVIGQLSSIVDDSIQFYWDTISEGTVCVGAKLNFERIPALLKCQDCQNEFEIGPELIPCPNCGSYRSIIIHGEEFYVDSIEIEKNQED
ncbi:MAG: hydrogenase maturation nickel metallochaperone HypA [Anaerolineaceae bacterium]